LQRGRIHAWGTLDIETPCSSVSHIAWHRVAWLQTASPWLAVLYHCVLIRHRYFQDEMHKSYKTEIVASLSSSTTSCCIVCTTTNWTITARVLQEHGNPAAKCYTRTDVRNCSSLLTISPASPTALRNGQYWNDCTASQNTQNILVSETPVENVMHVSCTCILLWMYVHCYSWCNHGAYVDVQRDGRGAGGEGERGPERERKKRDDMEWDWTRRRRIAVAAAYVSLICQVSLVCVHSICHASVGY